MNRQQFSSSDNSRPGCVVHRWVWGLQVEPLATPTPVPPVPTPMARIDGQRALFVIPDRFSVVEYRLPRTILEELGNRHHRYLFVTGCAGK